MKAYSLTKEFCADKITYDVGDLIGEGADGGVYKINNSPDKVIKFSVIYDKDFNNNLNETYHDVSKKINYIYKSNINLYPKVYDYKFLYIGERSTYIGPQQFLLHYYVMDKLKRISEDEKKVIHSVFSHEDLNIKKEFSPEKLENVLSGLAKGLDFNIKMVKIFQSQIEKSCLQHADIHARNVMKDQFGNFKLIDLDRLKWR